MVTVEQIKERAEQRKSGLGFLFTSWVLENHAQYADLYNAWKANPSTWSNLNATERNACLIIDYYMGDDA